MPKIQVRDIQMYYEEKGEGPVLVMIMGLGANLDWWGDDFRNDLSREFRTIAFDNRGSGRTDRPTTGYTIANFARDTIELMNKLDIKKAHIMGFSMGGMVAQEIALHYPERVDKLVLGCTNCGGDQQVPADEDVRAWLQKENSGTQGKVKDHLVHILFPHKFASTHKEFIKEVLKWAGKAPIDAMSFQRQLRMIFQWDGNYDRLTGLTVPVLVMHGQEDAIIPAENANILNKMIPESELRLFEGGGHGFNTQFPHKVSTEVLSFLNHNH
ncbi:alpha/beta fold hydrolase [Halobacillus naozhouensis]|uniref:Alpha/beta hydrolase n=1 Tax=Halobacillus naozhouensis TaxID=554880 RepID=A0ABY8IUZ7_9BACI|nr:alpha/beta hydrolase [Halobacillus naozhouensis]WFT73627.1 alpha/beta hydrolase [Halobacillus naozhouensis]